MVGWHHQLNGHESEQVPGAGDGQGSLESCSPWGRRVRHDRATELNLSQQQSPALPVKYHSKEILLVPDFRLPGLAK